MPTQFERTTISLTPQQMAGIDKMIEDGIYPDRTEAIRAATNMLLSMQYFPSLMQWYKAHPECDINADADAYADFSIKHCRETRKTLAPVEVAS